MHLPQNLSPVPFRIKRIPAIYLGKTPTDKYISSRKFRPVAARMERLDLSVRVASFTLGVERQGVFHHSQSDTNRLTEA